jgi:hypothetical protein
MKAHGKCYVVFALLICAGLVFTGCGGGGKKKKATRIDGTVIDYDTSDPIQGARVVIKDTATDTQYGETQVTDSDGKFTIPVEPGQYTIHVTAQGYQDRPLRGFTPTAVDVAANTAETVTIEMITLENTSNLGSISGTVLDNAGAVVTGVLVIADLGNDGYTTFVESDGDFVIFNVPAGTYSVEAFCTMYQSSIESNITVTAGNDTDNVNLVLTPITGNAVSGSVTFLAAANSVVDVTLVHPMTGDSIPGLQNTIDASGLDYIIHGVPDGEYHAFASYRNDGYVLDPDWVLKNGIPTISMNGVDITNFNFSVTDSVPITTPTNNANTISPLDVTFSGNESELVFEWEAYPSSTAGYVIEVTDIFGTVVWGGFEPGGNRAIVIPSGTLSVAYNFDGTAATLQTGMTYQWKIFALKNDNGEPFDFKLISVSEDLMGLIRLVEP